MQDSKTPRPEAITAARWRGDKLRELAPALKPVTAMTETEFVGTPASKTAAFFAAAQHRWMLRLFESLTEENIKRFEKFLAEEIDAEMAAQKFGVSGVHPLTQYHLGGPLERSLRRAEIEPYMAPTNPVFDRSMGTLAMPGSVRAAGGFTESAREALHELPIIES